MTHFLRNIELWLSGVGLIIIFTIPSLLLGKSDGTWHVMAITAVLVGVLHGVIFWLVRRRQRAIRLQVLTDISGMLHDVVNNQLTVIAASLSTASAVSPQTSLDNVRGAVERIAALIDSLSEESLQRWQAHYDTSLRQLPPADGAR